jgi:hypothetical protein
MQPVYKKIWHNCKSIVDIFLWTFFLIVPNKDYFDK